MAEAKKTPLESSFLNMVLVMTVLSLLSAAALGFTYIGTADRIQENQLTKQRNALQMVLPVFDNDPLAASYPDEGDPRILLYPASSGGRPVGLAVLSYSDGGFGGPVSIMVGFDADGSIHASQVIEHSETPGLGDHMAKPAFNAQFVGRRIGSPLAVTKDGGDIDAITAATISSRAYLEAVNLAMEAFQRQEARK